MQHLSIEFWVRWKKEYVSSLQKRSKWSSSHRNLACGDIVLISDQNESRNKWPMGKVVATKTNEDGCVRSVTVMTAKGRYDRPIAKLILLVESDCIDSPSRSF